MEAILSDAIKKASADYIEIRWEETETTKVIYIGKEVEDIGSSFSSGGSVRVLAKGRWGFVSFNKLDDLKKAVSLATEFANLSALPGMQTGDIESKIVKDLPVIDKVKASVIKDPRSIPLTEKQRLMEEYNQIMLKFPKIQSSQVRYRDIYKKKYFVNSEGTSIYQENIDTALRLTAIAREGENVQPAIYDVGGTSGYQIVQDLHPVAELTAKRALKALSAEPITAGKYTVILDPELTGLFSHEAFGHLSEADFLYENKDLQKLMKIGRRFGPDFLNLIDDATIPGAQGSFSYDDEGVKGRKTYLIKDGIFVNHLHSRETAAKMNEDLTGNGRALNFSFPPIVRMSNTFIEPQNFTFEELLEGIEEGIYAKGARGGQTNCEMFTFTAGEGYLIKKGKIKERIRDITLTGNVFETLSNIEMIGQDLKLIGGVGGCGKDGQVPLPISIGGPHIRIKEVLVGGK